MKKNKYKNIASKYIKKTSLITGMSMPRKSSFEIDPTKVVISTNTTEQEVLDESKDSSNSIVGEKVILDDTNAPKVLVYRYPKKDKFIVPEAIEYKEKLRKIRHTRNKKFVHDTRKEMMSNFKEGYHKKQSTIILCDCPNNQVPRYLRIANKLFAEKGYNVVMIRDGSLVDVIKSICVDKPYQCKLVLTV